MNTRMIKDAERYNRRRRRKKIWKKILCVLGCVVVFCTTYALILPAITLDKGPVCGLEEHEHTDSCYRTVEKVSRLVCTEESHEHTEECYDADGNLICGKLEVLEHVHDDSCFETVETEVEPVLICEKTEHLHSDACFEKDSEEKEAEEETAVNLAEGSQTAVIYTDSSCEEISDDTTVITVEGNLPENAKICAYPVEISAEQASEQMVLCAYDISIVLEDGTIYEPAEGESLKVSIQSSKLGSDKLDEELTPKIYYVPEKGEPEPVDTTVHDDEVSFEAEHFSVYMVLAVNANEVSTAEQLKTAIASGNENIKLKLISQCLRV